MKVVCSTNQPKQLPSQQARAKCSSSARPSAAHIDRRVVLAAPLLTSLALSSAPALAEEGATATASSAAVFKSLADDTLAYSFKYPTSSASGKKLNITFSRRPERYSSAAPLTADARQRIVCELVDLTKSFTVSVSVGPPSAILQGNDAGAWKPRDVAEAVLIDKSTARVSTGQRVALNSIEELKVEEREGGRYIVYEHISQGSPNNLRPGARETFRHALSVTTTRPALDGTPYLYTFNVACPDDIWDDYESAIREAVASFRLVNPTNNYVAPDKDPWMFF